MPGIRILDNPDRNILPVHGNRLTIDGYLKNPVMPEALLILILTRIRDFARAQGASSRFDRGQKNIHF